MKRKIALLMTMIVVMASVFGLSTVSTFAAGYSVAEIVWVDDSNTAGERPSTITVTDDVGGSFTIDTTKSDSQQQMLSIRSYSATFPDVTNYTKSVTSFDAADGPYFTCTYTYSPNSIDVTVPETINLEADYNGLFITDINVKNNSSTTSVNTVLSAEPYGEWSIVPETTDFTTMGFNEKKFSLGVAEPEGSYFLETLADLSEEPYTFSLSNGSADFILIGMTGPVTEDITNERCVTVSLYITIA